jgi:hypothetical protein
MTLLEQNSEMLKLLKNEAKVKVLPSPNFKLKDVGICPWEHDSNIHKNIGFASKVGFETHL